MVLLDDIAKQRYGGSDREIRFKHGRGVIVLVVISGLLVGLGLAWALFFGGAR